MKKSILFFNLFLFSINVIAQQHYLNELKYAIKTTPFSSLNLDSQVGISFQQFFKNKCSYQVNANYIYQLFLPSVINLRHTFNINHNTLQSKYNENGYKFGIEGRYKMNYEASLGLQLSTKYCHDNLDYWIDNNSFMQLKVVNFNKTVNCATFIVVIDEMLSKHLMYELVVGLGVRYKTYNLKSESADAISEVLNRDCNYYSSDKLIPELSVTNRIGICW